MKTTRKPRRLYTLFSQLSMAVLIFSLLSQAMARGQQSFIAIPPDEAAHYHIDFTRNFFSSAEAEKTDRAALYAKLQQLESLKGKSISSAENLLRALELFDQVQIQYRRHYAYLYLRNAVNRKDEASLADSSTLAAEVAKRTSFFLGELRNLDGKRLAIFLERRPSLKGYLFSIEDNRRYRPYTLSSKEEELLNATAPLNNDWQYDLYEKLVAHMQSGRAGQRQGTAAKPLERSEREERFKQGYAGFAAQRDLYAFVLMRLASSGNRLAKLRHYQDAAQAAYFSRYWTTAEVNSLLEQVAQQADLYKRYQKMRADYVRKIAGYEDVNIWDLSVRPSGAQPPRFTVAEASRNIQEALAPLGPEFGRELAAFLDPANGRMDILPGPNRKSGGFSQGFMGTDTVFYSAGFAGSYNDMRVLAHEATHAIHRQLMSRNHVLPANANGPNYLFESFAIFSEFLLPDYLYERESDPLRKQYFLEQFLEGKGTVMFIAGPEALLEQAVYDGVESGSIKGADDLDTLTKKIYSRFSIWPEKHDELKNQWMNVPLMYEDPFYDVNYVYGALLALKFYESYKRDPKNFVARYVALMSNGFDAPPAVLLKRFLDLDLNDPRLVSDAMKIIAAKVKLLEQSYLTQGTNPH